MKIFRLRWTSSDLDNNLQTQMNIFIPIEDTRCNISSWKSSDLDEILQTQMKIFKPRWNFQILMVNEVSLEVKIHGVIF